MGEASRFPFEAEFAEVQENPDRFVDAVFATLESEFLTVPKGSDFIEYPIFEQGYEALKRETNTFRDFTPERLLPIVFECPMALTVIRCILGLSPPEWAWLATERTGVPVTQSAVRQLDRRIRSQPMQTMLPTELQRDRVSALIQCACDLLAQPAPDVGDDSIHRLHKADTCHGIADGRAMAVTGVPYAMLLYERFLGRPFATLRDSVSEKIGDRLESAIEDILVAAGIGFQKTKRAERIGDFDQAPDFTVPDPFNARVVIEAKITQDDGTARDKVTRIQHLAALSRQWEARGKSGFEVVACIGGRGFAVRREDMRKLLLATRGKVFTTQTLDRLVACSSLNEYRQRQRSS